MRAVSLTFQPQASLQSTQPNGVLEDLLVIHFAGANGGDALVTLRGEPAP